MSKARVTSLTWKGERNIMKTLRGGLNERGINAFSWERL